MMERQIFNLVLMERLMLSVIKGRLKQNLDIQMFRVVRKLIRQVQQVVYPEKNTILLLSSIREHIGQGLLSVILSQELLLILLKVMRMAQQIEPILLVQLRMVNMDGLIITNISPILLLLIQMVMILLQIRTVRNILRTMDQGLLYLI